MRCGPGVMGVWDIDSDVRSSFGERDRAIRDGPATGASSLCEDAPCVTEGERERRSCGAGTEAMELARDVDNDGSSSPTT